MAGQFAGVAAAKRGPTGPFELSTGFLALGGLLTAFLWKENVAKTASNGEEDAKSKPSIKEAIQRKLTQEQEALEYEFRLEKARQEAEKVRIDAEGKAAANRILAASLTPNILKDKGIEATIKLAESPNAKVVVVGSGKDGLPLILGN